MRIRGLGAGMFIAVLAARPAGACEAPPPAVVDIDANSYYSDSHHSIVDPVRKARNEAAVKPVNDYLDAVAHAAVAWQRTHRDADARSARLARRASMRCHIAQVGTMSSVASLASRPG